MSVLVSNWEHLASAWLEENKNLQFTTIHFIHAANLLIDPYDIPGRKDNADVRGVLSGQGYWRPYGSVWVYGSQAQAYIDRLAKRQKKAEDLEAARIAKLQTKRRI
jgi:hypothetical protein